MIRRAALVTFVAAGVAACRPTASTGDPVDIVYAGSLVATLERVLAPGFEARTGRGVRGEPHGSLAGAHQIRDGVRRPDLFLTADPEALPLLGVHDPGWAIVFAAGEIAIGYAPGRFASALDSAAAGRLPWYEVLARPGFRFGRTDPALDPKGYRAVWAFQLAEERYGVPGLAERLLRGGAGREHVYPEPHLPARVEAGALDAGAFYLAEARAHGLRVIRLPPEANLGDPGLREAYARRTYRTPSGVELRGAPIEYAATIPANAPDPSAGEAFLAFLLSTDGREALENAGYPPLARRIGDAGRVPRGLRSLVAGSGEDSPP